jgi:acyl-CoA reductase-like NAD-dependent aldehyde dehydrogenase
MAIVGSGDPFDPATTMGPLAMGRQFERVPGYIEKGKSEGGIEGLDPSSS